jgi:predicted permease
MLLARATARRKEFAVRNSMGAGRRRLIRQLLTESFVLSCLGGLFGLLIARWAARFLLHFLPQGHIPFVLDLRPDLRDILFTAVLSILAALLFGTAPAVQSTRGDLGLDLKSDSSGSIGGKTTRLRNSLIVVQVAFSLALLILSGLFIQTVFNLRPHSEYAAADRILLFTMKPQDEIYTPDRIRAITAELIRRVSEIPGVQAVALAENGPFASRSNHDVLQTPGHAPIEVASDSVTPGFFKTIGIPLRSGRDFRPTDKPGSPKVVIVNQTLARALFNTENPVGKIVELPSEHGSQFFEVVGVVGDTHYYDLHIERKPAAFFAFQNEPPYMPTLHVRVNASNPNAFIPVIRRAFDQVDKGFPVFNIRTLELRIQDALARERMIADLSAAFGLLALALAAVGLYGTLSYSVARRTREIGIRMALGSQGAAVIWMIGREALLLVAMGVGIGCAVAICGGYAFSRALYGVAPADPTILSAASTLMFVTASVAACIPATRAARVDPIVALHYE